MDKTQYDGKEGIEITFNDYNYTEDGEDCGYDQDWIDSQERAGNPPREWIDPVWEIEEDEDNFIIHASSHQYHYLKSEIKDYKFYDTEDE
jgi:hypothetical protein